MQKNHDTRICIIGAGAAGLTAAETLRQKGYVNITLLERDNRAGGKCCSISYEGRSYELGAGIIAHNNVTVRALANKFQVPIKQIDFGQGIFVHETSGQAINLRIQTLPFIYEMFFRYRPLLKKYRLDSPGFQHVAKDICIPFSEWAKRHNMSLLSRELAHFFTGFGYGYFNDVPAAYVLKYYSWGTILSFGLRRIYQFPNGIQHLWSTIAATHHVLYNTNIEHIERGDVIRIQTATQTLEFDALIITSPLDEALDFLDASAEEKNLFSRIQYCDYRTYACVLQNFPRKSGYFPGNYSAARFGHPAFWYQRYPDSELYTFYVLGDGALNDDVILENINEAVQKLGGKTVRLHEVTRWKYFPHITGEDMKNGYYDQLEQLQGMSRTFYAGELMNFSTVGLTSEYAKNLIDRFF